MYLIHHRHYSKPFNIFLLKNKQEFFIIIILNLKENSFYFLVCYLFILVLLILVISKLKIDLMHYDY